MTHDLLFLDPRVRPGLNLTVRNGLKWASVTPGDGLRICKTGEEHATLHTGTVIAAQAGDFDLDNVPNFNAVLRFEHSPECRNVAGLKDAMDRAYGEGSWGPTLTFVYFYVDHPRAAVYDAINGERDYQEKWNTADSKGLHEVAGFVLFMEHYLHEARLLESTVESGGNDPQNLSQGSLDMIRKVVALGVSAMEQHGAPKREA